MKNVVLMVIALLMLMTGLCFAETVEVNIKGVDDGRRTTKQQDYKEAVLFAKREAIERAGVQIKSMTTVKDMVVNSDYIESKAEAALMPGYNIIDIGYTADGTYQVVLVGRVKPAGSESLDSKELRYAKSLYDMGRKSEAQNIIKNILDNSKDDAAVAEAMYCEVLWNFSSDPEITYAKLKSYYPGSKHTARLKALLDERAAAKDAARKAEAQRLVDGKPNSIGQTFVYIQPGTFMMGSPSSESGRDDDERQHRVTLTKGFYMQTTEVTQGQWKAVMGNNPSKFSSCGDNCPVERVSWDDVQDFIRKLNQRTGQTYRLPTEAEWEYAARAGTNGPFNTGDCLSTSQANYDGNYPLSGCSKGQYRQKTVPVASFAPNAWGLYDMHGNVWEWCSDWYGDYPSGSVTDSEGPSSGSYRVFRGGSWRYNAQNCRSAYRRRNTPVDRYSYLGFRLAAPAVR